MNAIHIILITLIILVAIIVTYYIRKITKLKFYKTRITEAEQVIEDELEIRYDLIQSTKTIVQKNTKMDLNFYEDLANTKNSNINTIEFEKKLTQAIATIELISTDYPKINDKKDFKEIHRKINESDTKLNAAKAYFNTNNNKLNELLKKFPTNIIGKLNKYKINPNYEAKEIFNSIEEDIRL